MRSTAGRTAGSVRALMPALSCPAALLTFIAHEDLVPEVVPDLLVDLAKARLESNFRYVARTGKVDLVVALDSPRPRGDDEHAVAQRDRLFEVVGDEHHRRRARRPQAEQLVLHQRARLHVESAEGLVHQENARPVDQALRQRHALAHAARKLVWI